MCNITSLYIGNASFPRPLFPRPFSKDKMLLLTVLLYLAIFQCSVSLRCEVCPDVDPRTCEFGTATNFCRRLVCAQGPGGKCTMESKYSVDKCDNVDSKYSTGICGFGLMCNCRQCTGCYGSNNNCFNNTICTDEIRSNDI